MKLEYSVHWDEDWVAWNEDQWDLHAEELKFTSRNLSLRVLEYRNRRGRTVLPPLNFYLPVRLESRHPSLTGSLSEKAFSGEWFEVAGQYAESLMSHRPLGTLALPPIITDVRPFQWAGFDLHPRYTYTAELPHKSSAVSKSALKAANRAAREGFSLAKDTRIEEIFQLVNETATEQGFRFPNSLTSLQGLEERLGPTKFIKHSIVDSEGQIVSGGVRLIGESGTALGWIQGTRRSALKHGVAQLMQKSVLEELSTMGATSYDYIGANIKSVALAKASWGMRLATYYQLTAPKKTAKLVEGVKNRVRPSYLNIRRATARRNDG